MILSLATQPNCGTVCGKVDFFGAFYLVVRQPCDAGTDTCPLLYSPILFYGIDIGEEANTHKAILCKYILSNLCTAVERTSKMDSASEVLFPRCTSTSRTSTFQEVFARLKNHVRVTLASDTPFSRLASASCH